MAYAISRQYGNAVRRNRLRRQLRAAAREAASDLPVGAYLVRPTAEADALTYAELRRSLREAMGAAATNGNPSGPNQERTR